MTFKAYLTMLFDTKLKTIISIISKSKRINVITALFIRFTSNLL